ncbi:hemicentin-1-like isoform X1, partial [Vespula squamosa]
MLTYIPEQNSNLKSNRSLKSAAERSMHRMKSVLRMLSNVQLIGPAIPVRAVLRGTAELPCDIRPPRHNDSTVSGHDSAILVVWYKNDMTPIYRCRSLLVTFAGTYHWFEIGALVVLYLIFDIRLPRDRHKWLQDVSRTVRKMSRRFVVNSSRGQGWLDSGAGACRALP